MVRDGATRTTAFTHADKPALRPFIREHLGTDIAGRSASPVAFDDVPVPDLASEHASCQSV